MKNWALFWYLGTFHVITLSSVAVILLSTVFNLTLNLVFFLVVLKEVAPRRVSAGETEPRVGSPLLVCHTTFFLK